ncbi:uncharacterized protein [Macaca fascicularis]|uniref:uncharacterized protein n=1 Tax=Macaca fascicularis TaxID=9541 RepID=UPI0032B057E1
MWEELAGGGELQNAHRSRGHLESSSRDLGQGLSPPTQTTPSVCFREDPEKLTLSAGGLPGAPGPGRAPSVVLPPTLPCPHILDESRRAAGALRSKAHWGLSSGVFKKEETKGSEAGPQVRSPAGLRRGRPRGTGKSPPNFERRARQPPRRASFVCGTGEAEAGPPRDRIPRRPDVQPSYKRPRVAEESKNRRSCGLGVTGDWG